MRVTDVFEGIDETLTGGLSVGPVTRVDSGRRGGLLEVRVELAPGVDPGGILVLVDGDSLALVRSGDRAVLRRIPLEVPVGRPVLGRVPGGLSISAPLASPVPVPIIPGLRRPSRAGRARAALARFGARLRALFGGRSRSPRPS
ncbi:hypothetical protein [Nocardiopsis alba]|uniref:Uncharacterized protein n=2 Tax=Nocardiopsis alba TaxID=53437 RepID=A0A7K2IX96_9ACTN|nr:hypothetical protein [Nocardiopsis alba]AFR06506.1 hypothetical protein B005_3975 [Nocardiopsis alba ATCC BAA-2165]MYR34610.1 hypothetical protein [Nocardiopsis alba]